MSNSVTNAKLPNGSNQNQGAGQTGRNNLNPTASPTVSAGQGREIFSQVNVNLGANSRSSDIPNHKDKSASNNNSEGGKTDWKSIRQGTDTARTAGIQGTNSPKTSNNPHEKAARPTSSDNRESKESTHNNNAAKSNNDHRETKSNGGNNDHAAKNRDQTARQNDENRPAKSNDLPRADTTGKEKNNGNQNSTSRGGGNSPAKSNNETKRSDADPNSRSNGSQSPTNKGQAATNAQTDGLNRGQESVKAEQNNPNPGGTAANASKDAAENTPLFNNRNQPPAAETPGRTATHTRQQNLTVNVSVANNPENTLQNNPGSPVNRQNGILGEVISQIFRENDVYLSGNAVNNLVGQRAVNVSNRSGNQTFESLPKEIFRLVEAIENQIFQTSDQRQIGNRDVSNRATVELPPELDDQIQSAKNLLTQIFGVSDAKNFSQLSIRERMLAAVELFLRNLPAEMPGNLRNESVEKILAGFLLARGLICADSRNQTENLLGMMQSADSENVSLAAMRDFGGLVKVLISDAAAAKSTVNLETAVQKFARILVAINCLDTVLTAVKLASQNQFANGSVGRTLAIVQVYELINRLVLAGQSAMREAAAEIAQKNSAFKSEPDKNSRNVFPAKTVADLTETDSTNRKSGESKNVQAESALRKFLEFNPLMINDKFVSAFESSDDAHRAQNDFLDRHQIEIEQWLRSGNHRLVKDVDFEKPIGIVVERGENDFFSATTARIVLVRDGSVQGWHFLKSFLVA